MTLSIPVFLAKNSNSNRAQVRQLENKRQILVILAIVATILVLDSAFLVISLALLAYTPTEVALIRYVVASLTLIIYAFIKGMGLPGGRDLVAIALLGLIGFTIYNLSFISLVALVISWLWLGEVPTPIALGGGVIIFFGVFLVNRRT